MAGEEEVKKILRNNPPCGVFFLLFFSFVCWLWFFFLYSTISFLFSSFNPTIPQLRMSHAAGAGGATGAGGSSNKDDEVRMDISFYVKVTEAKEVKSQGPPTHPLPFFPPLSQY